MRTALLAVAAVVAAGLAVPVTLAAAADPPPAGSVTYRDPAQAEAASLSVSGTLTTIHGELGREHSYAVSLPGGTLIPVSLDAQADPHYDKPRPFRGAVAITDGLSDDLADRGVSVDEGEDLSSTSTEGKAVVAAASSSSEPLPVQSATIGDEPTQQSTTVRSTATPSAHRMYVAAITNLGALDDDATIAAQLGRMRSYWTTESDGLISSFTQPTAMVKYATSATDSNSCGMSNPSAVWKEAAAKFSGIDFSSAGNHLMVLVPSACGDSGAAGIGTVGGSLRSGGRTTVTLGDTAVAIGVHELGHNLSLSHANAEKCSSSCATSEYWDLYSIMGLAVSGGSWTPAALDTSYRLLLGVDDAYSVPTVSASGTVHLAGRATTSGTRGFVVTDPSSGARYAVDYRSGTGRDAKAFYASSRNIGGYTFRPGVVIERMESKDDSTTMITRQSGGSYVTSFVAGEKFTRGSLTISVTSASGSAGADVAVTLPAPAQPTPTPTPTTPTPTPTSTSASPTMLPTLFPTSTPSSTPSDTPSSTPAPSSTPPSSTPPSSTPPTTPTAAPSTTPPATFSPGTPAVVGTPRVGQRLGVATTEWSPAPTRYGVQWLRNGRPVSGATRSSYPLTRSDYGKRISVVLTGSRDGYASASRTSSATRPVAAGRFSSRVVRIAGRAKVGRTLKVTTGAWRPSPSFSFRWYANGKPISKAVGRTLKVTKKMRGKRITVRVTARQYAYEPASRSVRTGRVR